MIEMAHEVYGEHTFWDEAQLLRLKAFADLVRADEREQSLRREKLVAERWAIECASQAEIEREACERAIEELLPDADRADCAAAIRARGNT
jgi:hypothetical protein